MKPAARIAALSLLFCTVPALADVRAGADAWARGDWATAVREWQAPAMAGDADAQFNLAQAYRFGRGVPRDLARAEQLYRAAAAQGHIQAADNFGLLLYQRGEHAAALPYVSAAAARGDPRAQYYLGIAHFNGEAVPKDWVRAYALVSIAHQAGLDSATRSLAEMDRLVPLEQRQQAVALEARITAEAEATRARQLAALDLAGPAPILTAPPPASRIPGAQAVENTVTMTSRSPGRDSPASAGADFARPAAQSVPPRPATAARPPVAAKATAPGGPWRIQLGAFAVAGNAEALWNRVRARAELAGHPRILDKGARVTRLLAGGFASQEAAQSACRKLSGAGVSCLVTKN